MFNKFKNELANLIADKVNANNDEVMLLTSEVDKLSRELDAKTFTINQLDNKLIRKNEEFEIFDRVQSELTNENETMLTLITN